ncbi:Major facilitator superfamily MFS-1 domain containing protein [Aphelenchoides besseyi]|nr:Major facilitator superfamily MFS-1 domain containing protein [Aphelenchoides besseyi]KAI6229427.1 Major facilitator superfamily MFS-1 domain containing protein [Aphelenchoides besseyi]
MTPKPDSSTTLYPEFLTQMLPDTIASSSTNRWYLPSTFKAFDSYKQKESPLYIPKRADDATNILSSSTSSVESTPELKREIANTILHPPGKNPTATTRRSDFHPSQIFRIGLDAKSTDSLSSYNTNGSIKSNAWAAKRQESTTSSNRSDDSGLEDGDLYKLDSRLFPSFRLVVAVLLMCCYITIAISTSNMSVALICMIKCSTHEDASDESKLAWQPNQEGLVLAATNAGSLLMLLTGLYADRVNGKFMVLLSLILCTIGNLLLPAMANQSFWWAVLARLAIGASDACMSPAVNSLITRWFPRSERAAAIGIITSGRQLGTLFIMPTSGYLCTRTDLEGGWPSIFYLSGMISALVIIFWLPMGADKPSKQYCISNQERLFIESRIACESIGKRTQARRIPWQNLMQSAPLYANVFSLICHEYPLVVMLQFLPNYMRDVLKFSPTQNGMLSALPIFFLFISKTLSASLSSYLGQRSDCGQTRLCKTFNAIGSLGLALSILCVPQFDDQNAALAIIALCFAMTFAGLHTPGCMTALLQLAPAFSGVITGISFFAVAWSSIANKILTKWIVKEGTRDEWSLVFYSSALVAVLPIVVFTKWGSDTRQSWAMPSSKASTNNLTASSLRINTVASTTTMNSVISSRQDTSATSR